MSSPLNIYVVGPDDYDRYLVVSARHEESARLLAIDHAPDGFGESTRVLKLGVSDGKEEKVHVMRGNPRLGERLTRDPE